MLALKKSVLAKSDPPIIALVRATIRITKTVIVKPFWENLEKDLKSTIHFGHKTQSLSMMMYNNNMKVNIDTIKQKVVPILKEAGVKHSAIFGSIVRGEEKKGSDIDILVDLPREVTLFGFVGLKHKLEDALGKKVDLVEYKGIKPRLKPYILNEQVPII